MHPAIVRVLVVSLALAVLTGPVRSQAADDPAPEGVSGEVRLSTVAADLDLRQGRRSTTAGTLGDKLGTPVRAALNQWADFVAQHDLSVVLPEEASGVVLGKADAKAMSQAAAVLDETWELLADLHTDDTGDESDDDHPAILVFLFDEEGMHSAVWQAVLDTLVERNQLVAQAARELGASPGPLMLRGLPGFLQPTFDMAGDASAGDDEFRLENELAHKLTQCVLKARFGEVPESIRWGMGFLVEQRQFQSIYQMNATGFVAAVDHFDWPKKTRDAILASYKDKGWALSQHAVRTDTAGRATTPQMITWGALDYLYSKDTSALVGLLDDLAGLHAEAAGWKTNLGHYVGEADATAKVLSDRLDGIDARKLVSHLKKVK